MGLREIKKQRVREGIIENAIALFREGGFEATSVKAIAEHAEISEATFFNYFATKDAVLSAWAHGSVDAAFEKAAEDGRRGVRPLLRSLCDELAAGLEADCDFASKAWLRARLAATAPPAATRLFESAQREGQLRRDVSARQLAEILYGAVCRTIVAWLAGGGPEGSLAPELRRATDLILDGARRRNERVRPHARAGAAVNPSPSPSPSFSTR